MFSSRFVRARGTASTRLSSSLSSTRLSLSSLSSSPLSSSLRLPTSSSSSPLSFTSLLSSTLLSPTHPSLPTRHHYSTSSSIMATPYNVHVGPADSGLLQWKQDGETAKKVSELLQKDLENHHVFFNADGFHNHLPHLLLTLYGTGASTSTLEAAYARESSYQIRAKKPSTTIVSSLQSDFAANAPQYLGLGKHYADFLQFFQSEMETKSWQDVLKEYVFREDAAPGGEGMSGVAYDFFGRLYAGFLHPMIQLMFGVEWGQPAIIAEALAQTAVHANREGSFFTQAEEKANASPAGLDKSLTEILGEIHTSDRWAKLRGSAHFSDKNKIHDGILIRAPEDALEAVSQIRVREGDLEERTAEMMHNAAFVAAGASWKPPFIPKFDFFLIHHLTSAPIFLTLNAQPWIPKSIKVRLLEWKMRLDIIQYIARGSPPLPVDILRTYSPPDETQLVSQPRDLIPRFHATKDDGHNIKTVRGLLLAQEQTRKFSDRKWVRIREEDWLRVHYMLVKSVESQGQDKEWVRAAGFDEAWEGVPKL